MGLDDLVKVQKALDQFPFQRLSCILATLGNEEEVLSSYAPFIKTNEGFVLFLSRTAPHFLNLISHPMCSLMLIEDESTSSDIYFRKRATFKAKAQMIPTTEELLALFKIRHGALINALSKMDFSFFLLVPSSGMIAIGQAQFFKFDENQKVIGRFGKAHGRQI
jgi:putative heme iron utilization protein